MIEGAACAMVAPPSKGVIQGSYHALFKELLDFPMRSFDTGSLDMTYSSRFFGPYDTGTHQDCEAGSQSNSFPRGSI